MLEESAIRLRDTPEDGASFDEAPGALLAPRAYKGWATALADQVYRNSALQVFRCAALKRTAAPGGTEGDFRARVAQYRESPNAWKVLSDGGSEHAFTAATGRWIKFERIIKTEPEATTLALDFRIANADFGEVWVVLGGVKTNC